MSTPAIRAFQAEEIMGLGTPNPRPVTYRHPSLSFEEAKGLVQGGGWKWMYLGDNLVTVVVVEEKSYV